MGIDWDDVANWGGHVHISTQAPDRHVEPDQEAS